MKLGCIGHTLEKPATNSMQQAFLYIKQIIGIEI